MKKIFTLAALLVVALSVSAQGYRKWDFTSWSPQTIANLLAEAAKERPADGWSDIEKKADDVAGAVAPEATASKCFWLQDASMSTLTANGVEIAETEGLVFNPTYCGNRSLAIAIDYSSTSLGEYAGNQYLWLGGGGKSVPCFTIPKVRIGQKMTFVVESHKPTDARGIELYVGSIDAANKIGDSFKPTTRDTYTWEEGWEAPAGTEGETVDIIVYNTSGCHIYSIEVGDDTQKSKVGYLYGGSLENDRAYSSVSTNDKYTVEPIEAAGALTVDQLTQYDAIVISSTVENAEAIASLKAIQPFVPTVNLNPGIYEAWGYGSLADSGSPFAMTKVPNNALFKNLELGEDPENPDIMVVPITEADSYQAVVLSETGLFAKDNVLATPYGNEELVAIHAHNLNHNGYLYLPLDQVVVGHNGNTDLLANAISVVAGSKAKISQAPAPEIALEYQDMNTTVMLKSTVTGAQIFYTIDGSTPTAESTPYAEPFVISQEGITVKAVALGDGYLLSEVAEQLVDLRHQVAAPVIAVENGEGKSIVTITAAEGATIYYNYSGSNKTSNSGVYEAPIELTKSRTIYAFAVAEGMVNSEVASADVNVTGAQVRIDILSHMDANAADYNGGSTSTAYYFSWGKDKAAYSYYNPDSRKEESQGADPETGDDIISVTYTELNPEEEKDFGTGWAVRSRGQIVDWENLTTGENIGDSNGYNYATVDDINPDFPATKAIINLADKNTQPGDFSFPYNAYLVTTQKYAGPFDVVINVGSIVKPTTDGSVTKHLFVLQTSADGNAWESSWQTLGDTIKMEGLNRLTKNITRSYEGTEEVYVRAYLCGNNSKVGFYDIYIANQGEKSQERMTGIEQVQQTLKPVRTAIYGLNGTRLSNLRRGFNIVRYADGSTKKVLVK
ncbi:MAG: chitobiase/beta-hexosaminidase C-terminal domain-containing protein [Prevotella sp.]|nr:chitobiase/beta-hexosaminidase C-terminal domain-containing protein [Prevotella sp.]